MSAAKLLPVYACFFVLVWAYVWAFRWPIINYARRNAVVEVEEKGEEAK